ncbi:MAG: single-stranded-DNA-specific exonuclease C-terminal domain-containing protein, partial [Gorillibacterium sp.]|nr:single-stranded-DNA-specific exonuclease C-terminal domain-containing protein [Gorillibacterium sp.]
ISLAEQSLKEGMYGVIVVAREGWNVGVIGIVASKLMDRFYRPAIVLSIDPITGLAKGSARSIAGFDMHKALTHCADLMEHYGGHQMAAGMTLHQDHIPALRNKLAQLAGEWLTVDDYVPVLNADLECQLEGQPLRWIRELDKLAPFGVGNPAPRFMFSGLRVLEKKRMGKDNRHLKLQVIHAAPVLSGKPLQIDAVGFNKGHLEGDISQTSRVDMLGELSINEWNGMEKAQMIIQDMRIEAVQVFDFRGAPVNDMRWRSIIDRGEPVGIVFASLEEAMATPAPTMDLISSRWYYSRENGVMLQWGEQADEKYAYDELEQLILYSLPSSMTAMTEALSQAKQAKRIYAVFRDALAPREAMPGKEMFKQVYGLLKNGDGCKRTTNIDPILYISKRIGLSPRVVRFIIEVFEELSFVECAEEEYRLNPTPSKRELSQSIVYQNRYQHDDVERELLYSTAQELTSRILNLKNPNLNTEAIV